MTAPVPIPPADDGVLEREPVVALVTALAGTLDLAVIVADGLDWLALNDGQTAACLAAISGVSAAVAAYLRSKVWAPATVARIGRANLPPDPPEVYL